MAGARVTVKNDATGEEFRQATDSEGAFAFLSLPIGRYSATVEAQGFKRSDLREIIIEVATPAKVNVALEVGSVSEAVSVSSEAQEVINTASPTLSAVVTRRQVEDLPLPTRDPLDLIRLQAGIAMASNNIRSAPEHHDRPDDRTYQPRHVQGRLVRVGEARSVGDFPAQRHQLSQLHADRLQPDQTLPAV